MIPSGLLKHRVTIQNPSDQTKSDGLPNPWAEPTTFASVWASIEPQSSGESFENNQVATTITHKVAIRYMPGINDSQRLAFQGRYFYINSVVNENEANHTLVLLCSEAQ